MISKREAIFILFVLVLFLPYAGAQPSNISNTSLINITLIDPKYGASQVDTFRLEIKTSNYSDCRYSSNPNLNYTQINTPLNFFTTTNHYYHYINDFVIDLPDNEYKIIYILCKTDTGYINDGFPKNFSLNVDRTIPEIYSVIAQPDYAIEKLDVTLKAETDDESVCRFDRYAPTEIEYQLFFNNSNISQFSKTSLFRLIPPLIEDNKNYTYLVTCMNRAGLFANTIKSVSFGTNLSAPNVIKKISPTGYIKTTDTEILIETNRDSTCKYGQNNSGYTQTFPQDHAKVHFIQKQNLDEGKPHIYQVRCDFDQGLPSIMETEISFIIDKSGPGPVSLSAESETCDNTTLNVNLTNNASDILAYKYRLVDSKNSQISEGFANQSRISVGNLTLARGEKYYWEAYAIDAAGNNGTSQKTSGTTILSDEHEICKPNKAPYLKTGTLRTETGITLGMNCTDDDGLCSSTKYLIINSKNSNCTCATCDFSIYGTPLAGIDENTTLCYRLTDNRNKTSEGNFSLEFEECTDGDNCCGGNIGLLCTDGCDEIETQCDLTKTDTDDDGISDSIELDCGLDPNNQSDIILDNDADGLSNKEECITYHTDLNKEDSDSDGFTDKDELDKGTDPNNKDDFPKDPNKDTDEDGIIDTKELECGLDPEKPDANLDNDSDGIINKLECLTYRTKVDKIDTDGDEYSDKKEIDAGTDPRDPQSIPKSHVLNIILFILGIGSIIAGAVMFVQQKPKSFDMPNEFDMKLPSKSQKPSVDFSLKFPTPSGAQPAPKQKGGSLFTMPDKGIVNFGETKKEFQQEAKSGMAKGATYTTPLEKEIQRKRELMKMKSMSSIFDEFAKDNLDYDQGKINRKEDYYAHKQEEREKTFRRLEDISDENAFEKIEKISKKDKDKFNNANRMTSEENEKLERLSRRGRK